MKIFVSYGHEIGVKNPDTGLFYPDPNNESVVRKFVEYLRKNKIDVWIDRDNLVEGVDWREKIAEGIAEVDVAVLFLTPKAVGRKNCVCRDELDLVVDRLGGNVYPIVLEEIDKGRYPSYVTQKQFDNTLDGWRERWTSERCDDAWFDERFAEILKRLGSSEFSRAKERANELRRRLSLAPIDVELALNSYRTQTPSAKDDDGDYVLDDESSSFVGRKSLFDAFEETLARSDAGTVAENDKFLWLRKGPGFGKSRLAAELLERRRRLFPAPYFVAYNQPTTRDGKVFAQTIAYRLALVYSAYAEALYKVVNDEKWTSYSAHDMFRALVVEPLGKTIDGERPFAWILVDALDEAASPENGRNEIAELIASFRKELATKGLGFFVTSRDDAKVKGRFAGLDPLGFSSDENDDDIRRYVDKRLRTLNVDDSKRAATIDALVEKAEGAIVYPKAALDDVAKNNLTIDEISDLPSGMIGYVGEQFMRTFQDLEEYDENIRPLLTCVLFAKEPATRGLIKNWLGFRRDAEIDNNLRRLGTFFRQAGAGDEAIIEPFHKSVSDYCSAPEKSGDYCISANDSAFDFADRIFEADDAETLRWTTRERRKPDYLTRYFLKWAPTHLLEASAVDPSKPRYLDKALELATDFGFLEKRLKYGALKQVLNEYIRPSRQIRANADAKRRAVFDAYVDVIRSNAHYLRRDSDENPAHKIMLQRATEIADECPVTQAAELWLSPPDGESPCDWFWLREIAREKEYYPNPCKMAIENAGNYALVLKNGNILSWGTPDFALNIWNPEIGERVVESLQGHKRKVGGVIELSSGDVLSWSEDHTLHVLNPIDGVEKAVCRGHKDLVRGAIELSTGDVLSWSWDKTLRIWNPTDGEEKAVCEGHEAGVRGAIQLSSVDVLSWSDDHTLRIWNPSNGKEKAVCKGHKAGVRGAIQLSSEDVLSWSDDHTLRIWNPINGKEKAVCKGHEDGVRGAIQLSFGDVLSWSWDNTLRVWNPSNGQEKAVCKGHETGVSGAIQLVSNDVLSWSWDKTLRVWNPTNGEEKAVYKGHKAGVRGAIQLSPRDVLSWSEDHTLRVWNPSNGQERAIYKGHEAGVIGAIQLSSRDVLSWNYDHTLRVWNHPDCNPKAVCEGHEAGVKDAIQLSSGDVLLRGYAHTIRIWNPTDGKETAVCKGDENLVIGVIQFSSGDVLSWNRDHTLRVYNLADGNQKAVCKGHEAWISCAIQLSSGDVLSWSADKTLRIWNATDCQEKAVCKGHEWEVRVAIQLSSGVIVSIDWNDVIRKWESNGTSLGVVRDDFEYVALHRALFPEKVPIYDRFVLHTYNVVKLCFDETTTISIWNGSCGKVLIGRKGVGFHHKDNSFHFLRLYYGAKPFLTLDDAVPKILEELER